MRFCRSLIAGATALLLSVPTYATTIPSVASGEAADREAALTSALRHAIEQVVGMSVNTSTYVSNLKSIQDKIYTGATGYVESYEVVDEQRTPTGYRVTVSAKVSKEKLSSAVAPIVGDAAIKLDGQLVVSNLMIGIERQKDAERTLKSLLEEFNDQALRITFNAPRFETTTTDPKNVKVLLDNFKIDIDYDWYRKYRSFVKTVSAAPFATEVFDHGLQFANIPPYGMIVELVNGSDEIVETRRLSVPAVCYGTYKSLFDFGNLPFFASPIDTPPVATFTVPTEILKHIAKVRVRNLPFEKWPVPL